MPRPKKRLGQHFLFDPSILGRIADALDPAPDETVLEIGPGRGTLTAVLRPRVGRLVVLEKDRLLVPGLRERFPDVTVVEGDALEADWHALARAGAKGTAEGAAGAGGFSVIGNIPYNITTPLIDKALVPPRPRRVVFLVQLEVADRVAAGPGSPAYGALGVGVQAVARVERLFTVPAGAFSPPPRVDSAVLRLSPLERPLVPDEFARSFRQLVVGVFGFRRKQLLRGIRELTGWPADRAAAALAAAGLEGTTRPEQLPPEAFRRLHQALVDGGWRAG
ncbi:MAG TPA: 16S rRNA (adenine(1518)-N(6)/adenine(1519)-N(6))-dimethyltransferase RsmA [Gemmatimonadales bacterium]|nr:16S rRNA (adenine(1518)-N(6)/adenine(1519)-N(6))-dimethyltransferase RsmA [Gemmatimonadales bacterium]